MQAQRHHKLKQHPAGSHLAMTALPFCPITAYGALALLLTPDALNEPGVPRGLCAQCAGIISPVRGSVGRQHVYVGFKSCSFFSLN